MIDNSDETVIVAEKDEKSFQLKVNTAPGWIADHLSGHLKNTAAPNKEIKDLSIDEVRKKYREELKSKKK